MRPSSILYITISVFVFSIVKSQEYSEEFEEIYIVSTEKLVSSPANTNNQVPCGALKTFDGPCNTLSSGSPNLSPACENPASLTRFHDKHKDCANSDEYDPVEAKKIYCISKTEKFIPTFADNHKQGPCDEHYPYRTLDGSCNNLNFPRWGKPNSTYATLLPPVYGDGTATRTPRRGHNNNSLPPARKIRTDLFPTGSVENPIWNLNAMIWGQFLAHDMSLLREPTESFPCCTADAQPQPMPPRFCFPIKVPEDDHTMGAAGIRCMNFSRTVTDKDLGFGDPNGPARQINTVTSYMDLSNVYGLNKEMSDGLRSFRGGKLRVEIRNGRTFPPTETQLQTFCPCSQPNENVCYRTGDSRSNQNPELAILQIIFVREHNRLTDELYKVNPQWDDEKLFQEARRILIAVYQRISYYEWMPIYNGYDNLIRDGVIYHENENLHIDDYNPDVEGAVFNEHAHGAFRFFHTHIVGKLKQYNPRRQYVDIFPLSQWFGRPAILEADSDNIEEITLGMTVQNLEETDQTFVDDVSDRFFACGRQFGIDLKAADIQRDRDHGLAYYNDYRILAGLRGAQSFDDYGDLISIQNIEKLKRLYVDYRDVDLSVGGALEELVPNAQYGPTFLYIVNRQFLKTRISDRFWFESPHDGFTNEQLIEIKKATVSRLFCDNGDGIVDMQRNGFSVILPGTNEIARCDQIPSLNMMAWKESNSEYDDY